jgi:hypothetical protein
VRARRPQSLSLLWQVRWSPQCVTALSSRGVVVWPLPAVPSAIGDAETPVPALGGEASWPDPLLPPVVPGGARNYFTAIALISETLFAGDCYGVIRAVRIAPLLDLPARSRQTRQVARRSVRRVVQVASCDLGKRTVKRRRVFERCSDDSVEHCCECCRSVIDSRRCESVRACLHYAHAHAGASALPTAIYALECVDGGVLGSCTKGGLVETWSAMAQGAAPLTRTPVCGGALESDACVRVSRLTLCVCARAHSHQPTGSRARSQRTAAAWRCWSTRTLRARRAQTLLLRVAAAGVCSRCSRRGMRPCAMRSSLCCQRRGA